MKPFKLTEANYHSRAAAKRWTSASAIKTAMRCEALWYAEQTGKYRPSGDSTAFLAGHLFENLLTLDQAQFAQWRLAHPELISATGKRKGMVKSEYMPVFDCAAAVRRSPFLRGVIKRCRKQVILTGSIEGTPVRMMADLVDRGGSIYDLKCMRDFHPIYDDVRGEYLDWWAYWRYPAQLWVYREIARQNGLAVPKVGLIAASKTDADVQAISFGDATMGAAGADVRYTLHRMQAILAGNDTPIGCGRCDWCLGRKKILHFEELE